MITEDYVSFEVAKLLKKKGFDEECFMFWRYDKANDKDDTDGISLSDWDENGSNRVTNSELDEYFNNKFSSDGYSAPTLQMAAKWLREEHNLSIDNTCSIRGFYCSVVHIVKDKSGRIIDVEDSADWETPYCKTLEEAFDKALKFCLEKLI